MTTFVFNPQHERETLEQFNERIKHFCVAKNCVAATIGALGNSLIVDLQGADAVDLPDEEITLPLVMPIIYPISDNDAMLEETIAEKIEQSEFKSNKDPIIPVGQQIVAGPLIDGVQNGYIAVLCECGEIEVLGEE